MNAREESSAAESNGDAGLLGGLPRSRPQRRSPRRAESGVAAPPKRKAPAAKRKAAKAKAKAPEPRDSPSLNGSAPHADTAKPKAARKAPRAGSATATKAPPRARARPKIADEPAVPPQGYESDSERARGSVSPPGGADFAATAFEAVSELARAGLSTSERLARDLLGLRR